MTTKQNEYNPQTVTHPGVDLREKLQEIQMPSKEFAVRCNKPVKTISEVLNGKSSITPKMAVQFENVLRIPANYWLQRQYHYNESLARLDQKEIINKAENWAKGFPYSEMANKGWVEKTRRVEEKASHLMAYFGLSSHVAWEKYYLETKSQASFRISLAHTTSPHALSAWLRRGDLLARDIVAPDYSANVLRSLLPEFKKIMAVQPDDFFRQSQELCLKAGVILVYTPRIKHVPINGAARWINNNNTPLIQMSCKYKRNDIYWFSFFHELGHILKHGKTDIFLEGDTQYNGFNEKKEKEADNFAIKWTFSNKEEKAFLQTASFDPSEINRYAKTIGTHPSIIIGRLQRKGLIPPYSGKEFFIRIDPTQMDY